MNARETRPRRLRLAVVTETYPPEVNGVARTIGTMVERLHARGHDIELVRPRQGADDAPPPRPRLATVLRRGMPIPRYGELRMGLPAKRALLRAWRTQRPDVVQVVTEGPLGASAVAAARRLGIPVASEFHTNFHTYSRHYGFGVLTRLVAGYLRRLHGRADVTMVPTRELADQLAAAGYRNLRVVGRGVDPLLDPGMRSVSLRAQWGASADDMVVAYVGRLAPEKNLGLFVDALAAMRTSNPAVRGVLIGGGPEAAALRVADRSLVFAGMHAGEDLARHYASADALVFPSMTETFGNVTTEALASGLAVVAFDYAAARQYIRHEHSGLLADFGDRDAFITQARRLAADRDMLARLREGARVAARALSWDAVIDELECVLVAAAERLGAPQSRTAAMSRMNPADSDAAV